MQVSYFKVDDNISIAYQRFPGKNPGIVFCCGFMSDMQSTKAKMVEEFCLQHGRAFLKFDYRGHGQSSGDPAQCSIDVWLKDALKLFDELTEGPQIIVGSSMGGWIATLIARDRSQRVVGLLGIAAAPDFTEDLIWQHLSEQEQAKLLNNKVLFTPSKYSEKPYAISLELIMESRKHLILDSTIAVNCKVRLLHGMNDVDVPYGKSVQLAEKLESRDVQVTLIKDGEHRLVREGDLELLRCGLKELMGI